MKFRASIPSPRHRPPNKVMIVVWVNLDPTADGRAAATLIAKGLINEMYGSSTPTPTR